MQKQLHCLLIDDDSDDQEIFMLATERFEAHVECTAVSGCQEALDLLNSNPDFTFDYIFLDLNMPCINGKQCLVELRKMARLNHVPVIIYSTSSIDGEKAEMQSAGANGFITKPSTVKELSILLGGIFSGETLLINSASRHA